MLGLFTVGTMAIAIPRSELHRIVEHEKVYTFPGMPAGLVGMIEVEGVLAPLLDRSVVVGGEARGAEPAQQLAVLRKHGALFAIGVDDVGALVEGLPESNDFGDVVVVHADRLWERVATLNEKKT